MTDENMGTQPAPAPQPQPAPQPVPTYAAPQPVYAPAPLMQLTGGMKFGWLVVGFLLGIGGIVISWLVNVDKYPAIKSEAIKFSIIGFAIAVVLGLIFSFALSAMIAAAISGIAGGYYY